MPEQELGLLSKRSGTATGSKRGALLKAAPLQWHSVIAAGSTRVTAAGNAKGESLKSCRLQAEHHKARSREQASAG